MRFASRRMMRAAVPSLFVVAPLFAATQPASATPYIHVSAFYQITPQDGLPAGIVESCGGDGCGGSLSVIHDFTKNITETASRSGSATFTNTAHTPYTDGFQIIADFSAFNSGGPEIGLGIDNASQIASFSSVVMGTIAYDAHSCSVPVSPGDPGHLSSFTCGVITPDSSQGEYDVSNMAPGATLEFDWSILISDSFTEIAEPSGVAILGCGLFAIGLTRSRHFHKRG